MCGRDIVNREGLGLGANPVGELRNSYGLTSEDDEYSAYRKRMQLAYKFRPNPLVCSYLLSLLAYYFITLLLYYFIT